MRSSVGLPCRCIRRVRRKSLAAEAFIHRRTRMFKGKPARIGIFTAYYNSSAYFETHLACIRRNTRTAYDYYVMKNYTQASESSAFDAAVKRHGFPKSFYGVAGKLCCPLRHGDSLQRMVSLTDNEIIVLCDVDAYLIKNGWDEWVLKELETKELVAVIAHFDKRVERTQMKLVAHPSFMAFRRSWFEKWTLDLYEGGGNDPGYKITQHFVERNRLDARSITPLVANQIEFPNGTFAQDVFGLPTSGKPSHGFCAHYDDLLFHFWHSMNYAQARDIMGDDGEVLVPHNVVRQKVEYYNGKYGDL
jgi:hypothetical protein